MIRRILYNFAFKYRNFMIGRYGNDELNSFLLIVALILLMLSRITGLKIIYLLAMIALAFCCIRMYSRNISARHNEKTVFLKLRNRFMSWYRIKVDSWRNRKTHKYFRCKNCNVSIRVPRGVGKIEVTCPKCRKKVIKKV